MTQYWNSCFEQHLDAVKKSRDDLRETFTAVARQLSSALAAGNSILLCGNGGSFSDAQHIAAEFSVRFVASRKALSAMVLACDGSTLTACGNDFGFDHVFSRQIEAHGRSGDVLIAFSTSGSSANIVAALKAARSSGITTVLMTGQRPGPAAQEADYVFAVPSTITARIQEVHILVGHALCGQTEMELGLTL